MATEIGVVWKEAKDKRGGEGEGRTISDVSEPKRRRLEGMALDLHRFVGEHQKTVGSDPCDPVEGKVGSFESIEEEIIISATGRGCKTLVEEEEADQNLGRH